MKKVERKAIDNLAELLPVISVHEQRFYVGGATEDSPIVYTQEEFNRMLEEGNWGGGIVDGMGYVAKAAEGTPDRDLPYNPNRDTGIDGYDLMFDAGYECGYENLDNRVTYYFYYMLYGASSDVNFLYYCRGYEQGMDDRAYDDSRLE